MWFTSLQTIFFKSSINLPTCTYKCNWPFKFRFSTLNLLVLCILSPLLSSSQLQNCNQDITMEVQNAITFLFTMNIYRVIQEKRPIFWEVIV